MATTTTNGKKSDSIVTIDDLAGQLTTLKNEIASLTSAMGDYGKAKTAEVSDTAKSTVNDLSNAGRERALDAQKQAEEFVRTQPSTALGIAAGVGFLVGMITARR
ncbi:Membrane-anchored ribosome-binding protein, inhibits growth in stationary phase, ElaB/YqjD/DUF883 family [Sulfitobacter brevis]|uniref:Membrane-anchored ribosome-binding protein, inhibits growth in stationary phase, ElaB/YqjD/DUF883 family n=1 Tax=Sulfitobacter brevis TaxID=74348 RepID=A0A1I1XX11_9RHOB|nr:DUF883 family protein [Sulfitobacter brevis]SFE11897.1 Membrane-anchored ribosome-binding protein, inhibits growth in stationary phase, ElaB/YqjD/DUF883 family [Sulfitobacter brevis]